MIERRLVIVLDYNLTFSPTMSKSPLVENRGSADPYYAIRESFCMVFFYC